MPERIPSSRPTVPTTAPQSSNSTSSVTVRAGDTLSAIASRSGTTVAALVEANRSRFPTLATNPGAIRVGWELTLPSGSRAPATPSTPAPNAGWQPRSNNEVLHIGMGDLAKMESDHLRSRGATVTTVKDGAVNDQITVNGHSYDLSNQEGARAFALTLGLPAEQTMKIADAISSGNSDAKDELAQIAQVWAKAEHGGQIPSRLVISGHNVGSGPWGDHNGQLSWTSLGNLAEAMPRAARSVEDIHIAACYSGGESAMQKYQGMFPNAKTIFAYTGSAPGSASGATVHMSRWEQATRGSREDISRAIVDGTRKGENVAVWSKAHGYQDGRPPMALDEARSNLSQAEQTFTRHLSGQAAVTDTQDGPLRGYYNTLQRLLQHPELPAGERPALEAKRDQTIRLNFYSAAVAPKFASHYSQAIQEGFQSVGMPAPDFSRLSRADALRQIEAFEAKLRETNPPPAAATRLLPKLTGGLRDLNRSVIPDNWV